jgi:very-short-patch-repair endonuclease
MRNVDEVIARLAARQHSIFLGTQAVRAGVTRRMLRVRVARGQLTLVGPDTYLVAGAPMTWEAKVQSLLIAAGDDALVSHRAAAALWGIEGFTKGTPEITVPRGKRLRRADARVHESTDLGLAGVRRRGGLRVTDPARTMLDLARRTGDRALHRAIESARRQGLTSWSELIATLAKHARSGRPGITRLRRVIAANAHREEITDSDFELLVIVLLVDAGLREPLLHHRILDVGGRFVAEVDLAYPEVKLAIELDGKDHLRGDVFESDRPRQNRLVLEGWTVLRFTWQAFVNDPEGLVAEVRAALRRAVA